MTEQQAHAQDGDEIIEKAITIIDATRAKFKPGSRGYSRAAQVASRLGSRRKNSERHSRNELAAEFRAAGAEIMDLLEGLPRDSDAYAAIVLAAAEMMESARRAERGLL